MKKHLLIIAILLSFIVRCDKDRTEVVTEWIGIETKKNVALEKTFKTAGKGSGPVTWWAGGYTWEGGFFAVELIDVKNEKTILKKVYAYGDTTSGNDEKPRFQWWHSEEKNRILLTANRVYKMKLQTWNIAQPGAGWGLWLYEIGSPPRRHEDRRE